MLFRSEEDSLEISEEEVPDPAEETEDFAEESFDEESFDDEDMDAEDELEDAYMEDGEEEALELTEE